MTIVSEHLERTEVRGGWRVVGAKKGGGGGGRQPVESPDSLKSVSYAKVIDLLGEGENEGLIDGLRSVMLNGTPIQNSDGSLNFQGVTFDYRSGTQDQSYIPGFPAAERPYGVNLEVKQGTPWVRSVTARELSAVRIMVGVNGLSKANTSNGDIGGYRIEYAIDLQTGTGAWKEVLVTAMAGKTTSSYRRSHRIDLPESTSGWTLRVRRITPNATSSTVADYFLVDLFTEVIDGKMRYPMSTHVGLSVDASQFSGSVPTRAYDMKLRRIRVPSNYDPETRQYTGSWDGSFKVAWSDCPPWVVYDMITNDRYGLGNRIPASFVDKWTLYNIARYCDEMVPDGRGGTEPRFTCNCYFQKDADAIKVLQDLVSVFRGMLFWSSGTAVTRADMPRDPVYTYTQANVLGGRFVYTGSKLSDKYTSVLVSYTDREDMGRQKIEAVVASDEIVARHGYRPTELTAFACSSRGQARRVGEWAILTSHEETRAVSFSVGLDGVMASPGQVIRVADNLIAGKRIGGRIVSATRNEIEVETDLELVPGDEVTVTLPSGVTETRTVVAAGVDYFTIDSDEYTIDSDEYTIDKTVMADEAVKATRLEVDYPFTEAPLVESVWALEQVNLKTQLFTVMAVMEGSEKGTFEIMAVQHQPGKYAKIDYGTKIDDRPITVVPPTIQTAPTGVTLTAFNVVNQGVSTQVARIDWTAPEGAVEYDVEWQRDDSDWVKAGRVFTTSVEINGAYAGTYVARVRALDAIGSPSTWATSTPTILDGIMEAPASPTVLRAMSQVMGIALDWGFPEGRNIIQRTEVWYGEANNLDLAKKMDFAYPQNTHTLVGLASGKTLYFWARFVDKNGLAGPWFPGSAGGVVGQASADAGLILDYLNGQITETQLAQALIEKIESADGSAVEVEAIKTALAAMYTIKTQLTVDGKPYMAGIGVGVENNEGIITSQILLAAQRVSVLNEANGVTTTPFVIQDGQVFMNTAIIGNASIGSAKFADWLESEALGPGGVPVLRMNFRTGEFQLNSAMAGGGRISLNNRALRVYDAANTLRVEVGELL